MGGGSKLVEWGQQNVLRLVDIILYVPAAVTVNAPLVAVSIASTPFAAMFATFIYLRCYEYM